MLFLGPKPFEFELVALRSLCVNGGGYNVGKASVQECAKVCERNAVSMFSLQRTEFCSGEDNCKCYCLFNANPDGVCAMKKHNGYDTYKIVTGRCLSS